MATGDSTPAAGAAVQDAEEWAAEQADKERQRLLQPTFTVAGKRVTLRSRLPAKEGGTIYKHLSDGTMMDMVTFAPFLALLIESWEFDGDPRDPASYGELDTPSELMPLVGEVTRRWTARVDAASPKA